MPSQYRRALSDSGKLQDTEYFQVQQHLLKLFADQRLVQPQGQSLGAMSADLSSLTLQHVAGACLPGGGCLKVKIGNALVRRPVIHLQRRVGRDACTSCWHCSTLWLHSLLRWLQCAG